MTVEDNVKRSGVLHLGKFGYIPRPLKVDEITADYDIYEKESRPWGGSPL